MVAQCPFNAPGVVIPALRNESKLEDCGIRGGTAGCTLETGVVAPLPLPLAKALLVPLAMWSSNCERLFALGLELGLELGLALDEMPPPPPLEWALALAKKFDVAGAVYVREGDVCTAQIERKGKKM